MFDKKEFTENFKQQLYVAGRFLVEKNRESMRPDFNDLGLSESSVSEKEVVRKYHAKGAMTKHVFSTTDAEKTKRSGKSKAERRLAGVKISKAKNRKSAGKIAQENRKRRIAMMKRGN